MDGLLGYMVAMVLSLLSVAGFIPWARMGVENVLISATASQMVAVDKAALQYVQDNSAAIVASTAGSTTVPTPAVTAANLITLGYLPVGFSPTNPFKQAWQVQVLQPISGQLQALVTSTGGNAITNSRELVQIAAQAGAQGGFVPIPGRMLDPTMTTTNAYGAYGAWQVPLANFAGGPGQGHLASLLAFSGTSANNSYLYRVAVPGQAQLNSMQTDLGMTDVGGTKHNITGINAATATTYQTDGGSQFQNDQGGSMELGGNNGSAGAGAPYIDFHFAGQGVQDYNARIQNDSNNHLTIYGANGQGSLSVQGAVQVGSIAVPAASCSTPAAIAANSDGSGQILSCLRGAWVPIGGHYIRSYFAPIADGTIVTLPPQFACSANGTPIISVTPSESYIDTTAVINFAASSVGAGSWAIHVTDGGGAPVNAQGVAEVYCSY